MWRLEEVVETGKKPSQPGWDYVVDTGFDPSKAPITPANKKRTTKASSRDTTAKQNAAILRRLNELEKDNAREVQIPVPSRQKEGAGRSKGKTAATRKILLAQKTFTNYLADEEAFAAQEASSSAAPRPREAVVPLALPRQPRADALSGNAAMLDSDGDSAASEVPKPPPMRPASDGLDDLHLLQSVIPQAPSEAVMEKLTSAPPLSYNTARVQPSDSGKPLLRFCEMCGYWGNYKCRMCGSRYCGLTCKVKHDVDCQKYGAR